MSYYVLTLFPELIENYFQYSIMGKALQKNVIGLNCLNIRDFANNKHHKVDDYPYGGGPGMVMQPQPIISCYESISPKLSEKHKVIYLSPQGRTFDQAMAKEYVEEEDLVFLCGHYEGIDERVIDSIVTDEVSVGDYILTGGELGALIIMDAVTRLIPGVLNKQESYEQETFSNQLLEYPQYTRPPEFRGQKVPDVLLSGHHKNIEQWRRKQSLLRTAKKRPDLLKKIDLSLQDKEWIEEE